MKIGMAGAGFMGKAHCIGFAIAETAFSLPLSFELDLVAEISAERARKAKDSYGFARSTDDWHDIVDDQTIELVDITTPNALHKEIALAAISAGKHVYCEKPLALRADDALEMAVAARTAGVKTQVGFNYLCNPMLTVARDMIQSGELGEIYSYRGIHAEAYMADPNELWTFRHDRDGGGALADIGSHALATAEFLLGPIGSVNGHCQTVIDVRKDAVGRNRKVEVDDITHAMVRFENGATGIIEANWVATGRNMQHDFEVFGSRGALAFSQERLSELHYYNAADRSGRRGFRRIEAGPEHEPYGMFCMAPGHQIGFNELKAIEISRFADALAELGPEPYDFYAGYRIQFLIEAIQHSSAAQTWVETGSLATDARSKIA